MAWQSTPYVLVLFTASAISLVWALYALERWRSHGRRPYILAFGVLCVAVTIWAFTYGVQLASTVFEVKLLAFTLLHVGSVFVPVAWLVFALAYTGHGEYLTRSRIVALSLVPLALLLTLPTNPYSLALTDVSVVIDGELVTFELAIGPLYQLFLAYSYVVVLVGCTLLIVDALGSASRVRRQSILLVSGALVPLGLNLNHVFAVVPIETGGVNLTPISLSVSTVCFGIAIFHYQVLDLTPIARKSVLENMREGVIVLDQNERIVDSNPAARRFLEFSPVSVANPIERVLPAYDRLDEESTVPVELTDEDEERTLQLTRSPLTDGDTTFGWVLILRDVTVERRQQRDLEQQNERLDAFTRIVSHDLRNSLSLIGGYTRVAKKSGDDAHLDSIEQIVSNMSEFLTSLLTLSQQGETIDDLEHVSLEAVVVEAVTNEVRESTTDFEIDANVTVLADRTRLRQIFENLIRNSTDHCGDDVCIRVGSLEGGFYVEDDGPGIPPEDRDAVFERGFTTNEHGTGLGLVIVEDIVTAHGWDVTVTAGTDGGARFEITGVTVVGETVDGRSTRELSTPADSLEQ